MKTYKDYRRQMKDCAKLPFEERSVELFSILKEALTAETLSYKQEALLINYRNKLRLAWGIIR